MRLWYLSNSLSRAFDVRTHEAWKQAKGQTKKQTSTVVSAFIMSAKTKRKRNENETETKRKRSLNVFFETRFQFFRNVLTFSQCNGKNVFRSNAFFFPETFFETF